MGRAARTRRRAELAAGAGAPPAHRAPRTELVALRLGLVSGASVILVLLAYLPCVTGPFFADDVDYVVANRALATTPPWRFFLERTNPTEYLPVRDLSYRADLALHGMQPAGFHVTNLLLYALCGFLLGPCARALSMLLPGAAGRGDEEHHAGVAAIATALFVAHPAHVESVAWISGRKDVLSGLFGIAALWAFAAGLAGPSARLRYLSAGLLAMALLSKATALPLCAVAWLLAYALAPAGAARARQATRAALPLLVVAAAAFVLHVAVGSRTSILGGAPHAPQESAATRAALILGHLARIAVYPADLRLIYDLEDAGAERAAAGVGAVLVLLGSALAARTLARRPEAAAFGLLAFALLCAPVLQIVPFASWSPVSERYLFLPLLGATLAAAALLRRLPRIVRVPVVLLLYLLFLGGTIRRAVDWSSPPRLFATNALLAPHQSMVVESHVGHLVTVGEHAEAARVAAAARDPQLRAALVAYVGAEAARARGETQSARTLAREAAAGVWAGTVLLPLRVADLALDLGEGDVAAAIYERVLARRPQTPGVREKLAIARQPPASR